MSAIDPVASRLAGRLWRCPVTDVMHEGVVSVAAGTDFETLIDTMHRHRVHAVAVTGDDDRALGLVSSLDLVRALAGGRPAVAAELAGEEAVTIGAAARLDDAVRRMADHDVTHLLVLDHDRPVGVVSTADVLRALT